MHKLILFDWGNVLLDSHSERYSFYQAREDVATNLHPQDKSKFMEMFTKEEFWTTSGKPFDDLVKRYLADAGCNCTVTEFKECYHWCYARVPWFGDMVPLVHLLAADNRFHIGILSTLCELDIELLRANLPLNKLDYRFFSFNLGVQKPDARIYDMVEVITGYPGEDILLIDDRADNIYAAQAKGWNTLLASGHDFEVIRNRCSSFIGLTKPVPFTTIETFLD